MSGERQPLLALEQIRMTYGGKAVSRPQAYAVEDATLWVEPGEVVGLVGESGSGKTTLGMIAAGMLVPQAGQVSFCGQVLDCQSRTAMARHRLAVQMVFQDTSGALNPRMTIGETLDEVLYVHRQSLGLKESAARMARRQVLLDQTGLARNLANRYPHALSGGQRQRVGIARALAVDPQLLIADEPVSALDVSVQIQILNLLKTLHEAQGLACLLIAHDLAVVRYMCQRVYVMRTGRIVESGDCATVYAAPQHPYTRSLLDAIPDVSKGLARRKARRPLGWAKTGG